MSVNDITGDPIRTDVPSDKYRSGWDAIWSKKQQEVIDAIDWELIRMIVDRDNKDPVPESCTRSSVYAS